MSCSQPPSSQRRAVRESRWSAARDARGERGHVGRVLRGRSLAHADRDGQGLGDADRLRPLRDQIALGDLVREQHAVAAAPLGGVEGAVGLLDERVQAGSRHERRDAARDLYGQVLAVDDDGSVVDRPLELDRAAGELASSPTSRSSTANSSPPQRATQSSGLAAERSRRATSTSTRSPAP